MIKAEWVYGVYYDELMVDGFNCPHCGEDNKFDGEDADYLESCGKRNFIGERLNCSECGKESVMPDYD